MLIYLYEKICIYVFFFFHISFCFSPFTILYYFLYFIITLTCYYKKKTHMYNMCFSILPSSFFSFFSFFNIVLLLYNTYVLLYIIFVLFILFPSFHFFNYIKKNFNIQNFKQYYELSIINVNNPSFLYYNYIII